MTVGQRTWISPEKGMGVWLSLLLMVALVLAACGDHSNAAPTPTPTPAEPTPDAAGSGDDPAAIAEETRQLVVWLPAFSRYAAGDAAGDVLQTAILQFQQTHPGVVVEVHVKAESGVAGIWPYLRAAQSVAPTILPDLALINTQHLWQAADLGMVSALDEADLEAFGDFYAAAAESVRYDSQILGVPYTVDVAHVIYDGSDLDAAPLTWEELLEEAPVYLFPGSSVEGQINLHTVAQYRGAGATLAEANSALDLDSAQAYFDFLATARLQGVIPPQTVEWGTFSAVYSAYQQNPSGLAAVLGTTMLSNNVFVGLEEAQLRYAPLPTRDGQPAAVIDSWAFAVLAQEGESQALALALIQALLEPSVHGRWSLFADHLPSRYSALAEWDLSDPYQVFLQTQLETAEPLPNGRAFADFARRLQSGQTAILRGDMTPEEALRVLGSAP